jgi:hypothetical protein
LIVAGTSPLLYIDLGKNEPGMILQQKDRRTDWRAFPKDDKPVISPIDLEDLPPGKYRLRD